jgi:hypothetical protein
MATSATIRWAVYFLRFIAICQVLALLTTDSEFRSLFAQTIAGSSYEAFFWEAPPVIVQTLNRPFECVLVEGSSLAQLRADPSSFSSHFASHRGQPAIAFSNLGGDALLVVPTPSAPVSCYTHLARFLRSAPSAQVDAFWKLVGSSMRQRVSSSPVWLSTAGMGVAWLHLRLDSRPKYYRHAPYTTPPKPEPDAPANAG